MNREQKRIWIAIGFFLFFVLIGVVLYNAFPAPACLYDLPTGAWICVGG